MLKGKTRHCDVCNLVILKGEKYAVSIVPKAKVEAFKALNASDPEMAARFVVDSQGNARIDICLDCRMSMSLPGEETVN
jgi:hypothetical protein